MWRTNLAALGFTFSGTLMLFLVCRSYTEQAYSSMGLTRVLYAVSFTSVALFHKFLLRKPRVLFALQQVFLTYSSQFRSWWMVTRMYLAKMAVAKVLL